MATPYSNKRTTKSQLYTREEILSILSTSDWVDSNTEI